MSCSLENGILDSIFNLQKLFIFLFGEVCIIGPQHVYPTDNNWAKLDSKNYQTISHNQHSMSRFSVVFEFFVLNNKE
jgi:hypothetical protein